MHNTKVILSSGELALAADKNVILTKRKVLQIAAQLFAEQIPSIQQIFSPAFTPFKALMGATPKVFKGENYKGFPYVMMDYPAHFSKNDIAAVRTMFWWGHSCSVTLHLKGSYKKVFENTLLHNTLLHQQPIWVCINENEWEHHFEPTNYLAATNINATIVVALQQKNFLKVAIQWPVKAFNNNTTLLQAAYKTIANLLQA